MEPVGNDAKKGDVCPWLGTTPSGTTTSVPAPVTKGKSSAKPGSAATTSAITEDVKKDVCPWLGGDAGGSSSLQDTELGDFEQSLRRLFRSSEYGISLHSRRKSGKKHKNVFIGSEAVEWIVKHAGCTRDKAVKIGLLWQKLGDFDNIDKESSFSDSSDLYQFNYSGQKKSNMTDEEIEKARLERFAMRRERVAAMVERHRETDPEYNANHHMLSACAMDDVDVVQFLVEEEGVSVDYELAEIKRPLDTEYHKVSTVMTRLLKPGDTAANVAQRFESVQVQQYLNYLANKSKKKRSKTERSKLKEFMGLKPASAKKPAPEVRLSGSSCIEKSEINFIEIIGSGTHSTVWKAQCRGIMVAVKCPKANISASSEVARNILEMSALRSPDVISLLGACLEDNSVMLVMELMSGSLRKLLQSRMNLTLALRMRMAMDIATGMNFLHSTNIVHGDLKSSNVLYLQQEDQYSTRVSDFGTSALFSSSATRQVVATPFYTAPEVFNGEEPSFASDVYSFGILLSEMLARKQPFSNYSDYDTFKKDLTVNAIRPPLPKDTVGPLKKLVERCWDQDPARRPGFQEILSNIWDIVVESAIPEQHGAAFWSKFVADREKEIFRDSISWSDFAMILCSYLDERATPLPKSITDEDIVNASVGQMYELCSRGHDVRQHISQVLQSLSFKNFGSWAKTQVAKWTDSNVEWKCLKEILLQSGTIRQVHMENFGQLCAAFGPLVVIDGGDTAPGGFLDRLRETMEKPWFFGAMSAKNSITALRYQEAGTFLLRLGSKAGELCLSRLNRKKEILHYRITRCQKTHTYSLENDASGTKYKSLPELVEGVKAALRLFYPCFGSPYNHLFIDETEEPVNYMRADF
mmetsp:Transcript_35739/g.100613  ORF Transcript_35739/g.100613 Transcript_35739/m.100613 type:complete len:865 (+) Transcript_35739:148-2742(+)